MRIVQIVAAHVEQGSDPALYGLGDDGFLYEWMPGFEPQKTKEFVMEDTPEEERIKNPWSPPRRQALDPVTKGSILKDKFVDGATAGWKLLGNPMSRKVPHPEDPTRHNRS